MHEPSHGGRAEEMDNTSGANRFWGLDITSGGDRTRQSGGNIGRGRFPERTGASRSPDRTGVKGEDSRVGTREGSGSADHRSIRQRSGSGMD